MFIESSFKTADWKARLLSPMYQPMSTTGCLSFWYHMWGTQMGTLNVYLLQPGRIELIFKKSRDQGRQWNNARVALTYNTGASFQIAFDGVVEHNVTEYHKGNNILGDIAIDDVEVDRLSSCTGLSSVTSPATPSTPTPVTGPVSDSTPNPVTVKGSSQSTTTKTTPGQKSNPPNSPGLTPTGKTPIKSSTKLPQLPTTQGQIGQPNQGGFDDALME